jgi:hypothetical protein
MFQLLLEAGEVLSPGEAELLALEEGTIWKRI